MNAFEDLIQAAFQMDASIMESVLGEQAQKEDQKWLKELEDMTKALTVARRTGNYAKISKMAKMPVIVKAEKLSEIHKTNKTNNEEMPAPSMLPPKKRIKKEKISKINKTTIQDSCRSSDVIIQEPVISTIEVLDSDEDKMVNTRSSRSRTRATQKELQVPIADQNVSTATEYEDAVSEIQVPSANSTFVLMKKPQEIKKEKVEKAKSPPKPLLNETVVIEKPTVLQQLPLNENQLLTDDESIEEEHPAKKNAKKGLKKENSYDNSPVKKKVEAFENMKQVENASSKANTSVTLKQIEQKKGNVREKALGFTPSKSKLPQKAGGTPLSSFRSRTPLGKGVSTKISKEQGTADRKTVESSEQKRKKYEEAYLKAQQLKEKEKEKALEIYKQKEERHKLLLQQKAEKNKQLKEEYEKKRLLAKQKAAELKNKETCVEKPTDEERSLQRAQKSRLIYLLKSPPRLPCSDCYDSDEEENAHSTNIPLWAKSPFINEQEKHQEALNHRIKNTLFCCQSRSVDLRKIFGHVDPRKLKRTSSANWDKPPRFTMLNFD